MSKRKRIFSTFLTGNGTFLQLFTSCAVIRPGEVGIKQRLGKFSNQVIKEGTVIYNPITSKIVKESTQTQNIKLVLKLTSDNKKNFN